MLYRGGWVGWRFPLSNLLFLHLVFYLVTVANMQLFSAKQFHMLTLL